MAVELKLDIHTEDLIKLIQQLPVSEKEKVKRELNFQDKKKSVARKAGFMKGLVKYMADDFDGPIEDFKDYM